MKASCAGCLGAGEGRADGGLNTFRKSALENNRNTGLSRSRGRQNLRMFSKNPAHSRVTKVLSTLSTFQTLSDCPFSHLVHFGQSLLFPFFSDEGMEGPLGENLAWPWFQGERKLLCHPRLPLLARAPPCRVERDFVAAPGPSKALASPSLWSPWKKVRRMSAGPVAGASQNSNADTLLHNWKAARTAPRTAGSGRRSGQFTRR